MDNSNKPNFTTTNPLKICVLPGDGIGVEVMEAALPVFEALSIPISLHFGKIGWECWKEGGNPVPEETWVLINKTDATLLGSITSKPLKEAENELPDHLKGKNIKYISPVIQLRQKLGLFANVRPITDIGNKNKKFNFCVIRENTEGLYAGLDFASIPEEVSELISKNKSKQADWTISSPDNATCAIRLQTKEGLERLFHFSFQYAIANGYSKITWADKPNVLRYSGDFSRKILIEVAKNYPQITWDIQNVDAVALWMVKRPESFSLIVAENMFGDILSDLGAGVMGGLGLAPSANIGSTSKCYFEPVHGSAPKYAGQNKANPSAMFLTIGLLLDHFGFKEEADRISRAINQVITDGKILTYDLGGNSSTQEMAQEIIKQIINPQEKKKVAIIAVGNELVEGRVLNTNGQYFAKKLYENNIEVTNQITVTDKRNDIKKALLSALNNNDAIIVCGGLGPTSDDLTRYAVSEAIGQKLIFHEESWQHICDRLRRFNIEINESNRQQALIPEDAEIIANANGTAPGFIIDQANGQIVFVIPGPPRECRPMFDEVVLPQLLLQGFAQDKKLYKWRLLGVLESEIAPKIEEIMKNTPAEIAYCWAYPYVDINISCGKDLQLPIEKINAAVKDYFVTSNNYTALERIKQILEGEKFNNKLSLLISDTATNGKLHSELLTPKTFNILGNDHGTDNIIKLEISGLTEYWQKAPFTGSTSIDVRLTYKESSQEYKVSIPYRDEKVVNYTMEFAAHCFIKFMSQFYPELQENYPQQ